LSWHFTESYVLAEHRRCFEVRVGTERLRPELVSVGRSAPDLNGPVYVYNDLIWFPYSGSIGWSDIAVIVHIDKLCPLYRILKVASLSRINETRRRISAISDTHFSTKGIFEQSRMFASFGTRKSDLRCATWFHVRSI
jgi:hypothetical protein